MSLEISKDFMFAIGGYHYYGQKHPPGGVLKKRCSEKYATNSQENTLAEV